MTIVNRKNVFAAVLTSAVLLALLLAVRANLLAESDSVSATVPSMISYQGQVSVGDSPFTGTGFFKFAIVDNQPSGVTFTHWSNDNSSIGGSEPAQSVQLPVANGLFSVLLGDTKLPGMTQQVTPSVFESEYRELRVWFSSNGSSFQMLSPDRKIASVPYALQAANADKLDGLDATEIKTNYENVVVVAKSGGDFTSIQEALNSIGDAALNNRYLVWVAPGEYSGKVTMKPFVDIEGAGQRLTAILYQAGTDGETGAVVGSDDAELRSLTVTAVNTTSNSQPVGIYNDGVSPKLTQLFVDVAGGLHAKGVYNKNSAGTVMKDVKLVVNSASSTNYGVDNFFTNSVQMSDVHASASLGSLAVGVFNNESSPKMNNVTAVAGNADENRGVLNLGAGSKPEMNGGMAMANAGTTSYGIRNVSGAVATISRVTVFSDRGSSECFGVINDRASAVIFDSDISAGESNTCNLAVGVRNVANTGSHTLNVDGSIVFGKDAPMLSTATGGATIAVRVGTTKIGGASGLNSPGAVCAFVYNDNYVPTTGPACP